MSVRNSLLHLLPPLCLLLVGCVDQSAPPEDESESDEPEALVLSVDTGQDRHSISPFIYGVNPNGGYDCAASDIRYGACRLGGNRWTAYGWETNLSNAGRDWCFQNDEHLLGAWRQDHPDEEAPPGAAATYILDRARSVGAAAMLTVPIVDYVASAATPGSSREDGCSGDVRGFDDYLNAVFDENRSTKDGELSTTPDLEDGVVYQDEFVALVRDQAEDAHVIFSLDNEPDLWHSTHPEVHPEQVGYQELVDRNVEYATAIRSVWPDAGIAGFASYGYMGYLNLGGSPPDGANQGPFLDYYLQQMQRAEDSAGTRLIDYVDLHWYPEIRVEDENGDDYRLTENQIFDEMVEARVQAPRSLWDDSFTESSWIAAGPIELLPWVQEKIDDAYPGTKIAITEWHYGAGGHISGGIAVAAVLGVFGREGVGLATLWPHAYQEPFVEAAFRVYRNYDGEGASFGDTSVRATSSDDALAAVFASVDAADPERLVMVAINRSADRQDCTIELEHSSGFSTAEVFTLTEESSELRPGDLLRATDDNVFEYRMPGYSVSVIVPQG
jgi:hypothetical protein